MNPPRGRGRPEGRWILTPPTPESLSLVHREDRALTPVAVDPPLAMVPASAAVCGSDVPDGARRLSARIRTQVRRIDTVHPEEPDDIQDIRAWLEADDYCPSATDSEASFEPEDDPEKLWCVCQRPWNQRHMILCDRCHRWFHSSCMGITKAESKRIPEWHCPKCSVKTVQEHSARARRGTKAQRKKKPKKAPKAPKAPKAVQPPSLTVEEPAAQGEVKLCMVCARRPCRSASVFCSDDCIARSVERVAADEVLPIGSVIRSEALAPQAPLKINGSSGQKTSRTTGSVDHVGPPEGYDVLEVVKRVSAPMPPDIARHGQVFRTSNRFFEAPLDVLLTFLYEAQTGQGPVHHQAIPLSDVQGGLIYVCQGPETKSADSKPVTWSGDGGTFTNVSITRYPLLPTSENIFEQICVMSPSVRSRKVFKRKVIWLSFCPDYVVVQYIGDALACTESASHDLPQVEALLKLPQSTTIISKTPANPQPTTTYIELLDDDDGVEEISVIAPGTPSEKLPESSRLAEASRDTPKSTPKKAEQGSLVVKSGLRGGPQSQEYVEDRLSRLKGISLTPSKGNEKQSDMSKVEMLDLEHEEHSVEVGFNPKILSVKSLRVTNENTPTKNEIKRNSMDQDEAVIIDIFEDEAPNGGLVSVKPKAGSGGKRRRCLKPRRNLPRTLKQSLYKELRKNSPNKVEPSPQESAVLPKDGNDDIEILSAVLPPEQERKKLVQVIVKPGELKALKNLGFTVFKSEN